MDFSMLHLTGAVLFLTGVLSLMLGGFALIRRPRVVTPRFFEYARWYVGAGIVLALMGGVLMVLADAGLLPAQWAPTPVQLVEAVINGLILVGFGAVAYIFLTSFGTPKDVYPAALHLWRRERQMDALKGFLLLCLFVLARLLILK